MPILFKSDIPESLWRNKWLYMPPIALRVYKAALNSYGLTAMAMEKKNSSGPIGGSSPAETREHFARRFGVSVCRMESVIIDPENRFGEIPDDLLSLFSDGCISVLDVPSGTGAAGISLLSTIAELRSKKILPKEPLTVVVVAGDYSKTALEIYEMMLLEITPEIQKVGIEVKLYTHFWDASISNTTAVLVDYWFDNSKNAEEYLAVILNFSGEADNYFKIFEPSFQHIHDRLHSRKSQVLWVEPIMLGSESMFSKLRRLMRTTLSSFTSDDPEPKKHDYYWFNAFQNRSLPCKVMLQRYVKNVEAKTK